MSDRNRVQQLLTEIIQSPQLEIQNYLSTQSCRAGFDIGWERAASEWMQHHFPEWKRAHWQQAVAESLQFQSVLN